MRVLAYVGLLLAFARPRASIAAVLLGEDSGSGCICDGIAGRILDTIHEVFFIIAPRSRVVLSLLGLAGAALRCGGGPADFVVVDVDAARVSHELAAGDCCSRLFCIVIQVVDCRHGYSRCVVRC